jgi:hypothetical protein
MTSGANILSLTVRKIDDLVCVVDMAPGVIECIGLSRSTSAAEFREHPLLLFLCSTWLTIASWRSSIFRYLYQIMKPYLVGCKSMVHRGIKDVHPDIAQGMSPLFRLTGTTAAPAMTNTESSACDACARE